MLPLHIDTPPLQGLALQAREFKDLQPCPGFLLSKGFSHLQSSEHGRSLHLHNQERPSNYFFFFSPREKLNPLDDPESLLVDISESKFYICPNRSPATYTNIILW